MAAYIEVWQRHCYQQRMGSQASLTNDGDLRRARVARNVCRTGQDCHDSDLSLKWLEQQLAFCYNNAILFRGKVRMVLFLFFLLKGVVGLFREIPRNV